MARLHRRGIGKVNIDKALGKNEYILQCFEGLDLAYKKLWDDAVEGSKMEADSYFWTLSRQATERVMIPIVRETVDAMDRCLLSAIMCWNGGHFPAGEIALRAGESFDKWFKEEFIPRQRQRWQESDSFLLDELNEYVCRTMEGDGVHPVHLRYFSTEKICCSVCAVMEERLLPAVKKRIEEYTPSEIRDSSLAFVRRRRLRKGVDSFFALKKAEADERYGFVTEILIDENFVLSHAEALFSSLRGSMWAEKFRLLGEG